VLRLEQGERAIQDENYELLTVAKTQQMVEIITEQKRKER